MESKGRIDALGSLSDDEGSDDDDDEGAESDNEEAECGDSSNNKENQCNYNNIASSGSHKVIVLFEM